MIQLFFWIVLRKNSRLYLSTFFSCIMFREFRNLAKRKSWARGLATKNVPQQVRTEPLGHYRGRDRRKGVAVPNSVIPVEPHVLIHLLLVPNLHTFCLPHHQFYFSSLYTEGPYIADFRPTIADFSPSYSNSSPVPALYQEVNPISKSKTVIS